MAVAFWMLRLIGAFAVVGSAFLSWRASVVLATCLATDMLAMLGGAMPTASFWTQAQLFFLAGMLLGFVALGRSREPIWQLPVLAFVVLGVLTASWVFEAADARELVQHWPQTLSRVLALPLGMFGASAAIRAVQRARAPSS
ncbi:MAG TPA: hypothetical protein VJR89_14775 [Polyangiales bacterium]|nr:hypothetical protein [Polyangiales bacterium]